MIAAGLGQWFGAYVEGRLAANLGLFISGTLARYQSVDTLPEYRRQGLASSLVYEAGQQALTALGVRDLVIIADDDYFAKDVYASVGFTTTERLASLERRPRRA
jgi:GNAT superfamily N-acetyltransferase